MKYTKKPVTIEAVQYDGNFRCLDIFSINEVGMFEVGKEDDGSPYLLIPTLEGKMKCSKGDYVIRGVKGEYYPCKPDIFEMTYEQAEPLIQQSPIGSKVEDDVHFGDLRNVDVDSFYRGYNKSKETLYTEDQVMRAIKMAREKEDHEYYKRQRPMLKYSPDKII